MEAQGADAAAGMAEMSQKFRDHGGEIYLHQKSKE